MQKLGEIRRGNPGLQYVPKKVTIRGGHGKYPPTKIYIVVTHRAATN